MGQIKRQSIISSLLLYVGVAFGFLNMIILLPWALGSEENFGFYSLLLTVGTTIALITQLGMPNTTVKYFPYFMDKEKKHNGFFAFISAVPLLGILVVFPLLLLLKEPIVSYLGEAGGEAMVRNFYWLFLLFSVFIAYFNVYQSYSNSLLKSAVPFFLRQVGVKLGTAILCLLLGFGVITLSWFFYLLVGLFAFQVIAMLIYLKSIGHLNWKFDFSMFKPELRKEMFSFTAYSMLARSAPYLVDNIDLMLITVLSAGQLVDTGIYTPYAFAGKAIALPGLALNAVAIPMVARAWKNNDLKQIDDIYQKTAINLLIIGGWVFMGICINVQNLATILSFFGENYAAGMYIPIFIGISRLFDLATGVNGGIITNSKYYYFNLILILFLLAGVVISDIIFIPRYGIMGAAIATAVSTFVFNFGKLIFVWWKFKLQPFTPKTVLAVILIAGMIALNYFLLPQLDNFILDILYRSVISTLLYFTVVLALNLSGDLTNTFHGLLRRVGWKTRP